MNNNNVSDTEGVELLPCPFCGSAQTSDPISTPVDLYKVAAGEEDLTDQTEWFVHCHACGIDGRHEPDKQNAIAAWNTRSSTTLDDTVIQGLCEALERIASKPIWLEKPVMEDWRLLAEDQASIARQALSNIRSGV